MTSPVQKTIASGIGWTSSAAGIVAIVQLAQVAILTRVMGPVEFGTMTSVTVAVGLGIALADLGMSNAILVNRELGKNHLDTLFWMSLLFSAGLVLALNLLAPWISSFFVSEKMENALRWSSMTILLSAPGYHCRALLQRHLLFSTMAESDILAALAGIIVSVYAAFQGLGVLALVAGQLAAALVKTLWCAKGSWTIWRPGFHMAVAEVRRYLKFGFYQMAERSVNYFSSNVDYILVGRFLGPQILGVYSVVYQLVTLPLTKINPLITSVVFPVYARSQTDDRQLCRGYKETLRLIALIVLPLLVGLLASAPLFVRVVYGPGWDLAIPLIQILSVLGILKSLSNPGGFMLLVKGRADVGFAWNSIAAVVNGGVFWVAVQYGILSLAWSWVLLGLVYSAANIWILSWLIGLDGQKLVRALLPLVFASVLSGFLTYGARIAVEKFPMSLPIALASVICVGATSYVYLVLRVEKAYVGKMREIMSSKGDANL